MLAEERRPECPTCHRTFAYFPERTKFQIAAGELLIDAEKLRDAIEHEDKASFSYAFPGVEPPEGEYRAETMDDDYYGLELKCNRIIANAQIIRDEAIAVLACIHMDTDGQYSAKTMRFPYGVTEDQITYEMKKHPKNTGAEEN